jgi:nucleoside-diphosphate-sugar epimerase
VAPGGYYALAKYTGEKLLEYVAGARGFDLLSLRVAAVFGPGDPHGSYGPNGFVRSLARDRSIRIFGQGEETRDHVHVDDVARLTVALMRVGAHGVYNVATGRSRSFAQVVEAIRKLVPYEVAVTNAPRKSPITHRSYDVTRLARVVPGFAFTPFEDGLRATLVAFGAL